MHNDHQHDESCTDCCFIENPSETNWVVPPKPSDEECLEVMKQIREKRFVSRFETEEEENAFRRPFQWHYPSLFHYMVTLSDEEALKKAKEEGKPILL
jgi:hypothetical protein